MDIWLLVKTVIPAVVALVAFTGISRASMRGQMLLGGSTLQALRLTYGQ